MSTSLGENIRLKRIEKGIKQTALAHSLNVSQSHLSDIENGKVSPKWDEIVHIADALGVELSEILPSNSVLITNNTFTSTENSQQNVGQITINIPMENIEKFIKEILKDVLSNYNHKDFE